RRAITDGCISVDAAHDLSHLYRQHRRSAPGVSARLRGESVQTLGEPRTAAAAEYLPESRNARAAALGNRSARSGDGADFVRCGRPEGGETDPRRAARLRDRI